jgi:hypothetical protein
MVIKNRSVDGEVYWRKLGYESGQCNHSRIDRRATALMGISPFKMTNLSSYWIPGL